MNELLKPAFRALGVELSRYRSTLEGSRVDVLRRARVDVVVDGGANVGDYAAALRKAGFEGRIVSFEPLPDVFRRLEERAAGDPAWRCLPYALGDSDGAMQMQVAANAVSSSLLSMSDAHVDAAPGSGTVGTVDVTVRRLDTLASDIAGEHDRLALKLDLQGYEGPALEGAEGILGRVAVVEAELSTKPLYDGQMLAHQVMTLLYDRGFGLVNFDKGLHDADHRVLQFDGLFVRPSTIAAPAEQTAPGETGKS